MPCDRLSLLKRLAVESPAQLQTPPWLEHMEGCGECRMEIQVLDGTLAVFKQIEGEGREQKEFGPSWETFSQAVDEAETPRPMHAHTASAPAAGQIAQEHPQAQKPRPKSRWRMMASLASAASVATVAATVVGVMFWPVDPLPEAPRKEASSAAPVAESTAGNAKSFRSGGGLPALHVPPATFPMGRTGPAPTPVFRELGGAAPTFPLNRWRSGGGRHPAPVILFRSLQNRKSLGMERPGLGRPVLDRPGLIKPGLKKPSGRASTRTVARPAKRPRHPRGPKTSPARSSRRPVAARSRAKGSSPRLGDGAVKSRVAVKPISTSPAAPFYPGASGPPPALRPKAEALTGIRPAAKPSLENMLAPLGEKLKLRVRMEAEEMAETDGEPKMNEEEPSPEDPESQIDANLEDDFHPANVAP